jgi:uncharacterized membrane protein
MDNQLPQMVQAVSYSPAEIVFVATSIIATMTTMGVALITAWRTSAKVVAVDNKVVAVASRIDEVSGKVDDVHTLTNKNFSEQKQEIADLRAQLATAAATALNAETARVILADEAQKAISELAKHQEGRSV